MSLGKNILTLRKKNRLSQEQLGEKVNVTRQTISNWELDETAPNPEQLKLLSKALQVSIDILVDNDIVANNSNKTISNCLALFKLSRPIYTSFFPSPISTKPNPLVFTNNFPFYLQIRLSI